MTLSEFLTELSQSGVATIDPEPRLQPGDGWQAVIREWDGQLRLELAGEPPALSWPAAEWAALRLYRGCQALVCRDMPPDEMHRFLAVACPEKRTPSVDYSVDLVFRFLPDLVALARRVAQGDPLVDELLALARDWPLSSVGIEDLEEVDPAPFLDDPSLRQLYVDRILATNDLRRLRPGAVRSAVKRSLGAFSDLAPAVSAALPPSA